jgi:DNA-binding transcriptional LysR family regulator
LDTGIDQGCMAKDPYILLDEGVIHGPSLIFKPYNFEPDTQYRVYDPYAIMSMIEQGLGISIFPKLLRTITLAYKDKRVLPIASKDFIDFIIERDREM